MKTASNDEACFPACSLFARDFLVPLFPSSTIPPCLYAVLVRSVSFTLSFILDLICCCCSSTSSSQPFVKFSVLMHICGDIFLLLLSFSSFSGISLSSSSFDLSVVLFQFASLPFSSPLCFCFCFYCRIVLH